MRELYRPLFLNETPMLFTGRETSELIKYAANAFLAVKITFINEMADLCEKVGADVQDVSRHRPRQPHRQEIPACRPRLWRLVLPEGHARPHQDRERRGRPPVRIVDTVVEVNDARKKAMADRVIKACGGS
jgi:UDPglucose 6-dehydrogenase